MRIWQIDKKHPDRKARGFAHKDFMFFDKNYLSLDAYQIHPQLNFSSFLSQMNRICLCVDTLKMRVYYMS